MYSIVEIAGHQYKVKAGDLIDTQKIETEEGSEVTFDKVLFVGGDKPVVGLPTVSGATVKAKVVKQGKDRKKIVYRRGVGKWAKKNGHRQRFTGLLITEISDGAGNTAKAAAKKAKKAAKSEKTEKEQ